MICDANDQEGARMLAAKPKDVKPDMAAREPCGTQATADGLVASSGSGLPPVLTVKLPGAKGGY